MNTPQKLSPIQLDARIIESRQWLNSDSQFAWDQEWDPEDTAALQTTTETGRRSCGQCGHPMRQETATGSNADRLARMGVERYHVCETRECSEVGEMIFS